MISIRSLSTFLALSLMTMASSAEPIQFVRTPSLSPDAKQIAFSYRGDIWTVGVEGGLARLVTMHQAQELYPIYSPDGKQLAFASKRHGGYDIYVVNVLGGRPRRLTFHSSSDFPGSWSPDGKHIIFSSSRSPDYPRGYELYSVPVKGGAVVRLSAAEGREGALSPDGKQMAYVRGPGAWYRKGYRGSSNNELWISDAKGRNNRQLTRYAGNDTCPMWSADGRHLYYVSDVNGSTANIVRRAVEGNGKPELITATKDGKPFHQEDDARKAQISRNGSMIVYACGPDVYVVSTQPGSQPRKVVIEAYADEKTNSRKKTTYTSNMTEYALSPKDEKHVAIVVHGEIFMMPVGSKAVTTRLTDSPANDHGVAWEPKSTRIFFLSDRSGHEEIYRIESNDPSAEAFTAAKKFRVARIPNTRGASGMMFAPNGSVVTFLRDGKLCSMKPDGTNQKVLVNEPQVVDYDWSPDSKSLVYARMDGSFATELYIMPASGGKGRNVTRYATSNVGVTWSQKGHKLAFLSQRPKDRSAYVLSLQKPAAPGHKPAAPGAPASTAIDWDDIHHRVVQPAKMEVRECTISRDGSKVALSATSQGKQELWVVSSSGGTVTKVTSDNARPRQIVWSKRSSSALYFRDGNGKLRLVRLASILSKSPTIATVPFKAEMVIDNTLEYTQMFDQGWRYLSEHFYDPLLHGVDWNKVREKYRPLIKHIALKEDLYSLMYLMMGELNASHLGVSGYSTRPDESTAYLGLLFDRQHRGRGLKIEEVVNRGPADQRGLNLKPGEYVLAINGTTITSRENVSKLLNDQSGKVVELVVSANPAAGLKDKDARTVKITATSGSKMRTLLYDRWVARNAKKVEELSGGKLGYIHIPSMNESGVNTFVRSLYSDNFSKEGIVLDVRFNGGGYTHEQILNYLGSKEHTIFRHRSGPEGLVLRSHDRKWTRPVVLLINNRSYSDAEILPNAFKALKLGRLVGQPTGGYVIGTSSLRLIDGSSFRIPRIGVFTAKGVNMEKEGVVPDVVVDVHPDQLARGEDSQLSKAVEVLKEDVLTWKEKKENLTGKAEKPKVLPPVEGEGTAPAPETAPPSKK